MDGEQQRASVRRTAFGIAAYAGAFGVSVGAVAVAAGLSVVQTCVLSLLMFSGASQVAFIGVVATGGSALAALPAALLLGIRNTFYAVRLAQVLDVRGRRAAVAAQFVVDETAAIVVARTDEREQRYAFWFTGLLLFVVWNLGTAIGPSQVRLSEIRRRSGWTPSSLQPSWLCCGPGLTTSACGWSRLAGH